MDPETVDNRAALQAQRARKPWSPPRVILSELNAITEYSIVKTVHYPDTVTPSGKTGS